MIRFGYLSDRIESAMEEQDFDGALKLQDALLELQQGRGRRVHQLLNPFHGRGVWREQSHGAQQGLQMLRAGPAPPEMPDAPTDDGSEDGGAAGGDAAPSADGGDASEVRSAPGVAARVCRLLERPARRRRASSLRLRLLTPSPPPPLLATFAACAVQAVEKMAHSAHQAAAKRKQSRAMQVGELGDFGEQAARKQSMRADAQGALRNLTMRMS
jgi:hypothetical protein